MAITDEQAQKLLELANTGKAWIRTAEDAVTDDGVRVSPYPELGELLRELLALRDAAQPNFTCQSCGAMFCVKVPSQLTTEQFLEGVPRCSRCVEVEQLSGELLALREQNRSVERCYTLIFAFTPDLAEVLLLRKATPPWQAGLWNGPGGKIEPMEADVSGAARELQEESGVSVAGNELTFVLRFSCDCEQGRMQDCGLHYISVYATRLERSVLLAARGSESEPVQLFQTADDTGRVPYVKHLLAMSLERLSQNPLPAPPVEGGSRG